jgi:hypothetical protein
MARRVPILLHITIESCVLLFPPNIDFQDGTSIRCLFLTLIQSNVLIYFSRP